MGKYRIKYLITDMKEDETVNTCNFFVMGSCYNKKEFNDFKESLLFDLVIYNAYYLGREPIVKIYSDKE